MRAYTNREAVCPREALHLTCEPGARPDWLVHLSTLSKDEPIITLDLGEDGKFRGYFAGPAYDLEDGLVHADFIVTARLVGS